MSDEGLIEELRDAFGPLPREVLGVGYDAFAWRTDAALATLDVEPAFAAVRGDSRMLSFTGPGVRIALEVCGLEIAGQLTPPCRAAVRLRSPGGAADTSTDEAGGFVLTVPSGLVSLLFQLPDQTTVVTSWLRV